MKTIYRKSDNLVISTEEEFIDTEEYGTTSLLCQECFLITKFNPNTNEFYEGVSQEEIEEYQVKRYEDLDREYTQKISDLISTHVQKFITRQIPIPQEILEEQQRLIGEFHELTNKELKK